MELRDEKGKFIKGNKSGGRPQLSEDIKASKKMSFEDMCRTVIEVRAMTAEDIEQMDVRKIPLGKRAIMNAFAKLDYRGIKDYEDRLWGKAKENIDLNPEGNGLKITVDYK